MKSLLAFGCLAALVLSLNACNKDNVTPESDNTAARISAADSARRGKPGSLTAVATSTLPAAVTNYINANYAGATVKEAAKDRDGNFVVVVTVSNVPKVLVFKADGTFVRELPPKGGHTPGDTTHHRGPGSLTTVAASTLPAAVTNYINANYAGATIREAKKDATGNLLVVITVNNTTKLLAFKADGTFVRELSPKDGHAPGDTIHHQGPASLTAVAVADLPAAIKTYVSTNYAGATIQRAGKNTTTGDIFVEITTTDNKRVGLVFGADGTFKKVITRR